MITKRRTRLARGLISQEDVQKVREATDLVALVAERTQVKRKGRDFWACCPLHQEKTPSFKIDPSTQLWHCFGCDEGGSAFDLVMKLDDLSFPEAVRKLAERAHIEIAESEWDGRTRTKRQRLKDVCRESAEFFHLQLMRGKGKGSAQAREYLSGRGLGGDVPKKWMLGFAPGGGSLVAHLRSKGFTADEMVEANVAVSSRSGGVRDRFFNRVMFPICDAQGDVIAFGGRIMEGDGPKYLNSQETPIFHKSNVLYGLHFAKAAMTSTGTAIVTEGYTDVIAMHKAGLSNAVAALGTALTRSHVRMLARHAGKRIVYIFDGDSAGQRATERALQFIDESITPESGARRMDVCALCLPDGMDPAEYLASHGPEDMRALVDSAEPLIMFGIKRRLERHDMSSIEGRAAALMDALDVLAPIKDSIMAKEYAKEIAFMLKLDEEDVIGRLAKLKPPRRYDDTQEEGNVRTEPSKQGQARLPQDGRAMRAPMSVAEANRLKSEREFLGLVAQHPVDALGFADALASSRWHDQAHLRIAQALSETLMNKLDASPTELIDAASSAEASAAAFLTAASVPEGCDAAAALRFFAEELAIGDMEEDLASLRREVRREGDAGETDAFNRMVQMQEQLSAAKNSHKPLG